MALSILIWLPAAAGLLGALVSGRAGDSRAARIALCASVAALGIAIGYLAGYHAGTGRLQHVTDELWIASLGIHYKLGVDGLNVALMVLATLLFAAAVLAANRRRWERPGLFYFHLMLAESAVLGALLAQDLLLFVAFFDLMLIPFYFLTGSWGGRERVAATTKLVIYTLVGSLLMLAAAVATGVIASQQAGGQLSFALSDLQQVHLPQGSQDWIFLCFAAAFLVKMPAFPLHGWMPDGYRAMPIEVLSVFSGVLSKIGAYGFLRIVLPLFPDAAARYQTPLLLIALASILYGSVMAFTQTNVRLIAGYSSVAQLGFITLGIFSLQPQGAQGALLQMVNHGIVVAPLFFIIALLSARAGGSEDIRDMGGIAFRAPVLAAIFLIVSLATLAMPGSANFVGEFLILLGVFEVKQAIAIVAFAGVVLASVYMLRAFIRSMHNRTGQLVDSSDVGARDLALLAPLVAVILLLSVYPQFALRRSEASVRAVIAATRAAPVAAARPTLSAAGQPGSGQASASAAGGTGGTW